VTLLAEEGEDAGRVQSVGARFAHNRSLLKPPPKAYAGPAPRQGVAASSWAPPPPRRWVAEALGCRSPTRRWRLPAILYGSIWLRRSARAVLALEARGLAMNTS